ncbi:MAG: serine/threonine protein kinase [Myxococcota bacterium]
MTPASDACENPPVADPLIGKTIDNRYTISRSIGEGGMARVYQAAQTVLGRDVALKILHPHISQKSVAVSRFFREARAAAQLRHTNTIRVFDAGSSADGLVYMAMELLHGHTVNSVILREGRLQVRRAIRIAVQICMSLAEAHDRGLVHRDLKPENIFLTREVGRRDLVKVLDFGIVKLMDDPELLHLTTTGSTPGTPYYMSPEAGMSKPVSPRSDLYSLGVILFEMLTGKRPFEATNPVQVVVQHLTEPPPYMNAVAPEAAISERLEVIVARLLAKDPEQRYATAYDVAEALLACVDHPDSLFGPKSALRPIRSPSTSLGEAPTAEAMQAVDAAALRTPLSTPEGGKTQVTPAANTQPSAPRAAASPPPESPPKKPKTGSGRHKVSSVQSRGSATPARKPSSKARRRRPRDTLEQYPAFEEPAED